MDLLMADPRIQMMLEQLRHAQRPYQAPAQQSTRVGPFVVPQSNIANRFRQGYEEARAAQRIPQLEKALETRTRELEDKAAAEKLEEQRRWNAKFLQKAGEIAADEALARSQMEATQAYREETRRRQEYNRLMDDSRKLQKDIQPAITTQSAMRTLDALIAPYMEGGELVGENVPGVGLVEGDPTLMGEVVRLAQDLFQEGSPNAEMYSAVRGMMNQLIKQDAGLQQTIHEMRNQLVNMGLTGLSDEEVFLAAYPNIRQRQNDRVRSIFTGYDEAVQQRYLDLNEPLQMLPPIAEVNAARREAGLMQAPPQPTPPMNPEWRREGNQLFGVKVGDLSPTGSHRWSGEAWVPVGQTGAVQRGPQ